MISNGFVRIPDCENEARKKRISFLKTDSYNYPANVCTQHQSLLIDSVINSCEKHQIAFLHVFTNDFDFHFLEFVFQSRKINSTQLFLYPSNILSNSLCSTNNTSKSTSAYLIYDEQIQSLVEVYRTKQNDLQKCIVLWIYRQNNNGADIESQLRSLQNCNTSFSTDLNWPLLLICKLQVFDSEFTEKASSNTDTNPVDTKSVTNTKSTLSKILESSKSVKPTFDMQNSITTPCSPLNHVINSLEMDQINLAYVKPDLTNGSIEILANSLCIQNLILIENDAEKYKKIGDLFSKTKNIFRLKSSIGLKQPEVLLKAKHVNVVIIRSTSEHDIDKLKKFISNIESIEYYIFQSPNQQIVKLKELTHTFEHHGYMVFSKTP